MQAGEEHHRLSLGWPLSGDIQAAPGRLTRGSGRTANGWGKGSLYRGTETRDLHNSTAHPFSKEPGELLFTWVMPTDIYRRN